MEHRKLFGKRVRALRRAATLTLEAAAERAQLSANYWGEVERSVKVPSLDTIVAMARALRVPPATLLLTERDEDDRTLRRRTEAILDRCDRNQLRLLHRIAAAVIEP